MKQIRKMVAVLSGATAVTAANAGGLSSVTAATNTFNNWLTTYVPILAVVSLIILGIGYAMHFVRKEQLGPFVIGCLIVGAASEIVGILMPGF